MIDIVICVINLNFCCHTICLWLDVPDISQSSFLYFCVFRQLLGALCMIIWYFESFSVLAMCWFKYPYWVPLFNFVSGLYSTFLEQLFSILIPDENFCMHLLLPSPSKLKKAMVLLVCVTVCLSVIKISTGVQAIIKVKGHQHQWLAGGYDLEIGHL